MQKIILLFRDGREVEVDRYSLQIVNSNYISNFLSEDLDSSSPIPILLFDYQPYFIDDSLLPGLSKEEVINFLRFHHYVDNTPQTMLGLMYLFKIFCKENEFQNFSSFEEIEFLCKWNNLISSFGEESSFRLFRKIGYFLAFAKTNSFQTHYLEFFFDNELYNFIVLFDGLWRKDSNFGLTHPHFISVCGVLSRTVLRNLIIFDEEKYEEVVEPYIEKVRGMYYHEGVIPENITLVLVVEDKFNFHNNLLSALFDPNFQINNAKNKYFIYPYFKILKGMKLRWEIEYRFDTDKNKEYTFAKLLKIFEYSKNLISLSPENKKEFFKWISENEERKHLLSRTSFFDEYLLTL